MKNLAGQFEMIMFHGMFHPLIIQGGRPAYRAGRPAYTGRASSCSEALRALPASDEVDYLDRIAGFELYRVILCARDNGLVYFDRHPATTHFEPVEQRHQAGVAFDRILLAVELDCEVL
jgi:hypothetical protein